MPVSCDGWDRFGFACACKMRALLLSTRFCQCVRFVCFGSGNVNTKLAVELHALRAVDEAGRMKDLPIRIPFL